MTCPYEAMEPANLALCEANVCGWVTQPANTWSNVGFFLVGAWVLAVARREQRALAGTVGLLAIATGLGSIAFHATSTLAGQLLDQGAMLLESGLFVVVSLAMLTRLERSAALALYVLASIVGLGLLVTIPTAGIALFAVEMTLFGLLELALLRRGPRISYAPLATVVALFVVAYAAWWTERLGVLCDPDNHVFGLHALWHFLGAASFPFWYRHFAQRAERAS